MKEELYLLKTECEFCLKRQPGKWQTKSDYNVCEECYTTMQNERRKDKIEMMLQDEHNPII